MKKQSKTKGKKKVMLKDLKPKQEGSVKGGRKKRGGGTPGFKQGQAED